MLIILIYSFHYKHILFEKISNLLYNVPLEIFYVFFCKLIKQFVYFYFSSDKEYNNDLSNNNGQQGVE